MFFQRRLLHLGEAPLREEVAARAERRQGRRSNSTEMRERRRRGRRRKGRGAMEEDREETEEGIDIRARPIGEKRSPKAAFLTGIILLGYDYN